MEFKINDIRNKIIKIIENNLDCYTDLSTNENSSISLYHFGLDSNAIIPVIADIEFTFNIFFSDEELYYENFNNISQIISIVTSKLSNHLYGTSASTR